MGSPPSVPVQPREFPFAPSVSSALRRGRQSRPRSRRRSRPLHDRVGEDWSENHGRGYLAHPAGAESTESRRGGLRGERRVTRDSRRGRPFAVRFQRLRCRRLLRRHQCDLVAASASSFLASGNEDAVRAIEESPETWHAFLRWETGFCKEPDVLDSGTQIIAVVRKASLSVDTE